MKVVDEFRSFVKRGNVLDLAVGFTVGSAFTALVKSLVDDLLMPPIGLLLGQVDFANLFIVLRQGDPGRPYATLQAAGDAGAVTWRYGLFINAVVSFFLVSVAVFFVIKGANRLMPKEAPPPEAPTTKECPHCYTQIPLKATRCPNCTSQLESE
jgi:large conductance mechanosensitive channel